MKRVLVVGAGFMGAGIAQTCAQAGHHVHLMDVNEEALGRAVKSIGSSLDKLAAKGLIRESSAEVLARIVRTADLSPATQADVVIESVVEVESVKTELFRELDRLAPPETILASNTSSIPISLIAQVVVRPDRVLGLHFTWPVPLSGMVEVIQGESTSASTFDQGAEFVNSLGKRPVRIRRDVPGFVVNRIFSAALGQAVELVDSGVASVEDVDAGMKLGYGWTLGPLEIADGVGLDTVALIMHSLKDRGESRLVPATDLVERMVSAGRLGRKAGKGFYDYGPDGKRLAGWRP